MGTGRHSFVTYCLGQKLKIVERNGTLAWGFLIKCHGSIVSVEILFLPKPVTENHMFLVWMVIEMFLMNDNSIWRLNYKSS